jgi:glycosyltransferase involved in cell wall biosynthesis
MSAAPILLVMPSLARGGAERHAQLIATELSRSTWAPSVLTFADGPLRAPLEAAGVPVRVCPTPGGARALPAAAAAVRQALDDVQPVLVSGHSVQVELATRMVLRERPLPNITWKHTYGHIGHRGLRERAQERLTGGLVTRYGAVCHTQVRYLTDELGLPASKISVVPNAVAVPDQPAPMPAGPPVVLMMAAMRADKDHARVLRAWPTVLAEHPAARLRLAGDGRCRAALERLATELGIASSVEFLGVRSDGDALLQEAHLLALASYAVECFPYAALEAMAAGRAVVSTSVAGLPEMVDDGVTGVLVPPRDTGALARALLRGLADATSDQPRLGPAGWARAGAVYALERWAVAVGDLFGSLVGGPARAVPLLPQEGTQS